MMTLGTRDSKVVQIGGVGSFRGPQGGKTCKIRSNFKNLLLIKLGMHDPYEKYIDSCTNYGSGPTRGHTRKEICS